MGVLVFGDRSFTDNFLENPSTVPVLGVANDQATALSMMKTIGAAMVAVAFQGQEGIEFTLQSADLYRDRRFFLAIEPEEVTKELWSKAKALAVVIVDRKTAVADISRQAGNSPGALTMREPVEPGEILRVESEQRAGVSYQPLPHMRIAVYSSKGGSGKTATACNIAASAAIWAAMKKVKYPVVLIDADIGGSKTARFWLGAGSSPGSLSSFADTRGVLSGALTRSAVSSMVMHHPSGLDYVLSPENATEANKIDRDVMARALINLSRFYSLVVCDMGSYGINLTPTAVEILQQASLILLVAEPDLPTTSDLTGFVAQAGKYNLNLAAMRLVVNQYNPQIGYSPQEMQRQIGIPLAGIIPDDINVKKLLNTGEGVLPVEKDINLPFSRAVVSLTQGILGNDMLDSEILKEGFLKRLFRRRLRR